MSNVRDYVTTTFSKSQTVNPVWSAQQVLFFVLISCTLLSIELDEVSRYLRLGYFRQWQRPAWLVSTSLSWRRGALLGRESLTADEFYRSRESWRRKCGVWWGDPNHLLCTFPCLSDLFGLNMGWHAFVWGTQGGRGVCMQDEGGGGFSS